MQFHFLRHALNSKYCNPEDALEILLWERDHGRRKCIAVIQERILRAAWHTQAFDALVGVRY